MRPKVFTIDAKPSDCTNPNAVRQGTFGRYGELHVEAGNRLLSQWESKYFSEIMPFVIPRMVSGPDFAPAQKWRRLVNSPTVTPQEFNRGMARRVEGQIKNDPTALSIIRSVCYKWSVEHASDMIVPYIGDRSRPGSVIATELVQAAQVLYRALWNGTITDSKGKKLPIGGDTTKLPHADGLTQVQRRLAWNVHFLCKNQPGGQQLRQEMGHAQFGARIVYGDCLFYTLSPNEQHSALVLRLSRYRMHDPCVQGGDDLHKQLRKCATRLSPSLGQKETAEVAGTESKVLKRFMPQSWQVGGEGRGEGEKMQCISEGETGGSFRFVRWRGGIASVSISAAHGSTRSYGGHGGLQRAYPPATSTPLWPTIMPQLPTLQ